MIWMNTVGASSACRPPPVRWSSFQLPTLGRRGAPVHSADGKSFPCGTMTRSGSPGRLHSSAVVLLGTVPAEPGGLFDSQARLTVGREDQGVIRGGSDGVSRAPVIDVRSLHVRFGEVEAVAGVDLTAYAGHS